ncbi:MAG: DUF3500 domain-containing protein [Planctomycetota bacterium]
MKHLFVSVLLLFALLLTACQSQEQVVLISAQEDAAQSPSRVLSKTTRSAANALLAALTDGQKKLAQYDIKAPLRKDWHFIPRERKGLMLGDMTADQKKLVHNLMQTALSDSGYLKATDIIWLETILYEMSNQAPFRDPGKYGLVIFGDPADEAAAWGWRLEGHHLSINLTYTAEDVGVTPLFFGANPAVVPDGPLAGKRVLADTHNLAVELARSMDDAQRKKMLLEGKPRDVITGPGRELSLDADEPRAGIDLHFFGTQQQVDMVNRLVGLHLYKNLEHNHMTVGIRKMSSKSAPDDHQLMFAWAGPIDADKPFYYRIQSSGLLVEYSCQGKNHVHCVVHDLTDPLQEDLLRKHYENHEHE